LIIVIRSDKEAIFNLDYNENKKRRIYCAIYSYDTPAVETIGDAKTGMVNGNR